MTRELLGGSAAGGARTAVPGFLLVLAACSEASAAWVGDRFFPSTLATTVPTPADFFNPPNLVRLPETDTTPSANEIDILTTYSKLIIPEWAVTFSETYRILERSNAQTRRGFDDFVLGTQFQLYADAQRELVLTGGGTVALGGTGSSSIANSFSTFTPTVYIGDGFGDLPDSLTWLRPVNVTANFGVALPAQATTRSTTTLPTGATEVTETVNPNVLLWSFALEYSLLTTRYSGANQKGRFAQGWVPLVELALQTHLNGPLDGQTTGTVNPGVIFVDRFLQVGLEAIVPINASSGRDIGVRAQAHLYFPAIFPDTFGKPIFGN